MTSQSISPLAGQPIPPELLVDINLLIANYYSGMPDPMIETQRVSFGTSGHRGSSLNLSFNESHVLAITQAVCNYRLSKGINGPLFLGIDTHGLSKPACASALEILAGNGIEVMLAKDTEYTPTPAISHAILTYNQSRYEDSRGLADGLILTSSHNPPDSGGLKYNPPHGGPAEKLVTTWIENAANSILKNNLHGVKRVTHAQALSAQTTHRYDFLGSYVADLINVIDMDAIQNSKLHLGVDPLGGAGIDYWPRIAEHYKLNLTIINNAVEPSFSFMTADWDGKVRMDPSSPYALQKLIALKDSFDIAFACDTDHDRHGIVAPHYGHLPANHYLSVMIDELFQSRPQWNPLAGVGKTVVSTQLIDFISKKLNRLVYEVPAGFKWFAEGLHSGALGFAGEQSAGASFLRRNGKVWTTDKDGITAALLAAEITARKGKNPGELYAELAQQFGNPIEETFEAPATTDQKLRLATLSGKAVSMATLAGQKITGVIDTAPGNNASIGGIKVTTRSGWFAARPSGTEDLYKIYAESFIDNAHLEWITRDAKTVVDNVISG